MQRFTEFFKQKKTTNMKSLLLLAFVSFSIITSAQTTYNVYCVEKGNWDGSNWQYEPIEKTEMEFIIQGRVIIVSDKAHSSYYCYEIDSEKNMYCYDESGDKCLLYFWKTGGQYSYLCVMYKSFLIRYYYFKR